jgi:hypothetical protein
MKKLIVILVIFLFISACTDSTKGRLGAYGEAAQINCYSGGKEIYNGKSTGKAKLTKGGFVKFTEQGSDKYIEIVADCVVKYE